MDIVFHDVLTSTFFEYHETFGIDIEKCKKRKVNFTVHNIQGVG